MATFTSWTDLLTALKADLASGDILRKSYKHGDSTVEFRDIADVERFLRLAERKAAQETGNRTYRTVAASRPTR